MSSAAGVSPSVHPEDAFVVIPPIPSFSNLDDEIWAQIFMYLSGPDVARLALCSKQLAEVGRDERIWQQLLQNDFTAPVGTGNTATSGRRERIQKQLGAFGASSRRLFTRTNSSSSSSTANAAGEVSVSSPIPGIKERQPRIERAAEKYKQLYSNHKAAARQAQVRAEQTAAEVRMRRPRHCVRRVLDLLEMGIGGLCMLLYGPLWLLFMYRKLTGQLDSWSWWGVFTPLFLFLVTPFVCGCFGASIYYCADVSRPGELCDGMSTDSELSWFGYFKACCKFQQQEEVCPKAFTRTVSSILWSLIVMAPILICAKLEGSITAGWGAVFVPLWILLSCGCLSVLAGMCACVVEDEDESWSAAPALWMASIPFLITLAIAAARLDGKEIQARYMFVPFFIMAIVAALAVLGLLLALFSEDNDRGKLVAAGLLIAVIIIGPAISEIKMSMEDGSSYGSTSWEWLLLPMVVSGFISMGALGLLYSWRACCDSRTRSRQFADLYSADGLMSIIPCWTSMGESRHRSADLLPAGNGDQQV